MTAGGGGTRLFACLVTGFLVAPAEAAAQHEAHGGHETPEETKTGETPTSPHAGMEMTAAPATP